MIRNWPLSLGLVCYALINTACAADAPKVITVGDWSKSVAADGYALRGRLVLCEKNGQTVVYVELQDASDAVIRGMRLFCDMGRRDFRPENKSGLECELRDKDHKPVPTKPIAFGGATPNSEWVTLPADGTIRLRASPFGIGKDKARAICPHLGKLWFIGDEDPNDYFLSATFTITPPTDAIEKDGMRVWRGTINLPTVRIPSKMRTPQK